MEIYTLGEKIKKQRKKLNMTLKDLAGTRITPGQISLVESGKSNPSMDLLEYLAQALNTSIEYLMESEEAQAEKICTYYQNMAQSYILSDNLTMAEQYIENCEAYLKQYNLEIEKAQNLYLRGILCSKRNENSLAQQYLLSSNLIFTKNNLPQESVKTFLKLGNITLKLKSYHMALTYFLKAEEIFNKNDVGDDFVIAEIYHKIAIIYSKIGKMDKAINFSYLANEKFKELNDRESYAKSLLLMSESFSKKGDIENGIKYSKKTLALLTKISDERHLSEIEHELGSLFFEFENIEESFIHLNRAKEIRKRNKDKKLISTLSCIAENYIKIKDIEKAKKTLDEMNDCAEDGDGKAMIKCCLLKYKILNMESKTSEAEAAILTALKYANDMNMDKEAASINITIGKYYNDKGNSEEAAKYLSEGVRLYKSFGAIKDL